MCCVLYDAVARDLRMARLLHPDYTPQGSMSSVYKLFSDCLGDVASSELWDHLLLTASQVAHEVLVITTEVMADFVK
jgi:hypothetical protein